MIKQDGRKKNMKFISQCPNCFTSSTDDSDETNLSDAKNKSLRKKILLPLAVFVFGCDKRLKDQRDYYSKFYTAPTIQPRCFSRGKKYEIERKHKVKKRDLLSNSAIRGFTSSTFTSSSDDNINNGYKGERVSVIKYTFPRCCRRRRDNVKLMAYAMIHLCKLNLG